MGRHGTSLRRRAIRTVAPLVLAAMATACGGSDDDDHDDGVTRPVAPTIAVAPASNAVTTAQTLSVAVTATASDGSTPTGGVTLTSGAFSSGVLFLSGGKATIAVPAGVLAVGTDTLTVTFVPDSGQTRSSGATGTASVTVSAAASPSVTAQSARIEVDGHPFQAQAIGANVFVSVTANDNADSRTGLRVYSAASPGQLAYRCTQPLDASAKSALGFAATPDGRGLAVAIENAGLDLVDAATAAASCGSGNSVVSQTSATSGAPGTFSVALTPDGNYAFVANEYGVVAKDSAGANIQGNVGVVALQRDASGQLGGNVLGYFSTGGQAIANVTISPDGRRLYVTSEIARAGTTASGGGNATLAKTDCTQGNSAAQPNGLLTVVDVAKAESAHDASAIIATVASGCSPVRVVETADQQVIWVAARGDNRVLAFSTHMLETNPDAALLGAADTGGVAPVGLALFRGGTLLAVANSNRFARDEVGNMTILDATPVQPRVVQTVAASYFPRTVTVAGDDSTLYLTNYNGGLVQVISTAAR